MNFTAGDFCIINQANKNKIILLVKVLPDNCHYATVRLANKKKDKNYPLYLGKVKGVHFSCKIAIKPLEQITPDNILKIIAHLDHSRFETVFFYLVERYRTFGPKLNELKRKLLFAELNCLKTSDIYNEINNLYLEYGFVEKSSGERELREAPNASGIKFLSGGRCGK